MTGGVGCEPVRLHFARSMDCAEWADRHAAGQAADRWPYGLHHLRAHGIDVVQAPHRAPRTVSAGRFLAGGYDWDRLLSGGRRALCWDERAGVPVALSGAATLTGVIWLSERSPRGPADAVARRALARARTFVLSSRQVEPLTSRWRVPADRVHPVPFGVDETFWRPGPGRRDGVLVVGNDRYRDHATAIRAVRAAGAPLTMVTSLPVPVPSRTLTHPELRQAYADCAVLAVATRPNHHASAVTTVLEAMACARPVVATRGGGLEEYVSPETGLLVDPGDHAGMAQALASLLGEPGRAREMGLAGREAVEARFTSRRMAGDLADLLRELA